MIKEDQMILFQGEVKLEAIDLGDSNWGIFCEHENGYSNILSARSAPFVFKHTSKVFIEHVAQELNNF